MAGIAEVLVAAVGVLGAGTGIAMLVRVVRPRKRAPRGFEFRYREFVLTTLRYIDLKGLQTLGHSGIGFDDGYIDVSVTVRAPQQVGTALVAGVPTGDRHPFDNFLDGKRPRILAVLGGPGSGKTTLLRKTARDICRSKGRFRPVPVLLYLRDHVKDLLAGTDLPELVRGRLGALAESEPDGWFDKQLAAGRCVVMFDGLDEVARSEDRVRVSAWVDSQVRQYPGNDFVLTSRPLGYLDGPVDGAKVLQVRPFTADQVRAFVHGWYAALIQPGDGETASQARARADADATDLLSRLDAAPSLTDLTVNPLLLTMIATVHRFRGALPGSRADLYQEICEVMLWQRQKAKSLPVGRYSTYKLVLLRDIAFKMMSEGIRQLPHQVVVARFTESLRRLSTPISAEDYFREVISDGLLVEWERNQYAFAHLTFQEYLAAAHIREKNLVDSVLVYKVDDPWWRETILLYTASSEADPIITACLAAQSVNALALAFDCLAEGVDLAADLRAELSELVDSAARDPNAGLRRQIIARALTARLDREGVRTASGATLWRRPVPANLYRLFLADTGRWEYIAGRGEEPARGVSGAGGEAFAEWLSEICDTALRLPTAAELDDPAMPPAVRDSALWTSAPDSHRFRVHPESADPALVTAEELALRVTEDFNRYLAPYIRAWTRYRQADTASQGVFVQYRVPGPHSGCLVSNRTEPNIRDLLLGPVGRVINTSPFWRPEQGPWNAEMADGLDGWPWRTPGEALVRPDRSVWRTEAWTAVTRMPTLVAAVAPSPEFPSMEASVNWFNRLSRLLDGPCAGQPVSPELAARIRLLALTMAADAPTELHRSHLREIAAGITHLERRWNSPAEMLILAVDGPGSLPSTPPR
ncbi:NACHT domain-containing protein [Actinokineospora auranticolor]|uniref:NACHT domain-containing protein n=1 Tax=Actinokineospora auranticolor TaxID=155976 RepID=A0A2S6GXE2_9PSEU|nr:NACHT domain-containing protein [Actinokineospora auranticolor]PPK69889.1 NACHT domain-containing protein [Actinokineospora auranticolor]